MIIRKRLRICASVLIGFGLNPLKIINSFRGIPIYLSSVVWLIKARKKNNRHEFKLRFSPVLADLYDQSGVAKGHYFHQDLWASRRIFELKPQNHIDVGSRIDGFVAHVLTFMDVDIIDVRPLESQIKGLRFIKKDMMAEDDIEIYGYESVSCLHALEHFGLGRYKDPLDWDGWKKGIVNISNLIKKGGRMYLSVPIGEQVIEFNAHRIFLPRTIIDQCGFCGLELVDFSFIDDDGHFHPSVSIDKASACIYGCGCFEFIKKTE